MPLTDLRDNSQKLADAAVHQQMQMWRAAQTVIACVPEQEERLEVLACLGLTDVDRPAGC